MIADEYFDWDAAETDFSDREREVVYVKLPIDLHSLELMVASHNALEDPDDMDFDRIEANVDTMARFTEMMVSVLVQRYEAAFGVADHG